MLRGGGLTRLEPLLPTLSGLSRLQLCELPTPSRQAVGAAPAAVLTLPGGPWLQRLRWLTLSTGTLLKSAAVLREAAALERVSVADAAGINWGARAADAVFAGVRTIPRLQCLSLDGYSHNPTCSLGLVLHVARLCRSQPSLLVQFPGWGREGETLSGFLRREPPVLRGSQSCALCSLLACPALRCTPRPCYSPRDC